MHFVLQPWQLCLLVLSAWVNREQQEVIEYLRTENQVLKQKLCTKRILLHDDQRRRLAVKGKVLGLLNSHLERFFLSLKSECLDRLIPFGESSLCNAVQQFLAHYHGERNHQGLANRIIEPSEDVGRLDGEIECRQWLGGLLRYYHRKAA